MYSEVVIAIWVEESLQGLFLLLTVLWQDQRWDSSMDACALLGQQKDMDRGRETTFEICGARR